MDVNINPVHTHQHCIHNAGWTNKLAHQLQLNQILADSSGLKHIHIHEYHSICEHTSMHGCVCSYQLCWSCTAGDNHLQFDPLL